MLDKNKIPQKVSGVKLETFGDGVLLYREAVSEAAYLNNSAAIIWALCDGKNTIADIEEAINKTFPEGKESIEEDIYATLERLQQKEAIELR
jgi:coenzyme PQQ biosynthesis protein PqqD